jgi:alpha-tubulin suppressor-like RCC1 family protein
MTAFLPAISFFTSGAAHALQPVSGVTQVSAGSSHTCAIVANGALKCWGRNVNGQVGNGTAVDQSAAVDVVGIGPVISIAAGFEHTCAVTSEGAAKCWGSSLTGELGAGYSFRQLQPVDVIGLSAGVTAITAGSGHSCALTAAGGVKCWGSGYYGQVGNGSTANAPTPVDVSGLASGVSQITALQTAACALTTSGGVKCWGRNFSGQLGDNTEVDRHVPVDVVGLSSGVIQVAGGANHACAVLTSGALKCWGWNYAGQLGDGSTTQSAVPVDVVGLSSGVEWVAAGSNHTCAVMSGGAVRCWGSNDSGALGDASLVSRAVPAAVNGLSGSAVRVSAGNHSCAVMTDGDIRCWGSDHSGALAQNLTYDRPAPVQVQGLGSGMAAVTAGPNMSCGITSSGGARCWGTNYAGQLGDGTKMTRAVPGDVQSLTSGAAQLSAGLGFACALTAAGGVKCWGSNPDGQLGNSSVTQSSTPIDVDGLASGVAEVAAGDWHVCARLLTGAVKCWGRNSDGQLGDGTQTQRNAPIDVVGLGSDVTSISVGRAHSCAVLTGGAVKCWGDNGSGQLGDGTNTSRLTAVNVVGIASGVTGISAGWGHTCVRTNAGAIRCWGSNFGGALGDGTQTNRKVPTDVLGLSSGAERVSAGFGTTCALMSSGQVKCWGSNSFGSVGTGAFTPAAITSPVDVQGMSSATAVSVGNAHVCAVTTSGAVKCWGNGRFGQLGDATLAVSTVPVQPLMFDTTPDPLSFDAQTDVPLSSLRTSNTLIVTGIEAAAVVAVQSGEYSIGCTTTFTDKPGSIQPGQSICVRHTSAGALSASVTSTLIVGGVTATFTSITVAVVAQQRSLIVSRSGDGTGSVTSAQGGITCGADCSESYPDGLAVTLTAAADPDSTFMGWSGVNCRGGNSQPACAFIIRADFKPQARFHAGTAMSRVKVTAGSINSMAIRADGGLYTWGGRLIGEPGISSRLMPGRVGTDDRWSDISAGEWVAFGLKTDGTLWSWGQNFTTPPPLGNSSSTYIFTQESPAQIVTGSDWSRVVSATEHTMALRADGSLWGWGGGAAQVGVTTTPDGPTRVGTDFDWVDVSVDSRYSVGVKANGTLWRWGHFDAIGMTIQTPEQVGADTDWIKVSAGMGHVLALKQNGTIWAFGVNDSGAFGTPEHSYSAEPVQIGTDSDWISIAAGNYLSTAIKADGRLFTWGLNAYGQLGRAHIALSDHVPTVVAPEMTQGWLSLQAGIYHVLAIRRDGAVWAWGSGGWGQLGNGRSEGTFSIPIEPGKYSPTIALSTASNPVPVGQPVSLTAAITGNGAQPSGSVQFKSGQTPIVGCESVGVIGGAAVCNASTMSAGAHIVTAIYSGDGTYSPAISQQLTQVIGEITLTVTKSGSGTGGIASGPAGIDCGAACSASFGYGVIVTLTATPASGSIFTGWSGACTAQSGTCAVTMNEAKSVTATFALGRTVSVVIAAGQGSVTGPGINCPGDCSELVPDGTTLMLFYSEGPDRAFVGWSGACSGRTFGCALTVDSDKNVNATFGNWLEISNAGWASRVTSGPPEAIDCINCTLPIVDGAVITLTAVPDANRVFTGWSGACTGTGTCTVTMTQRRTVTATFAQAASYQVSVQRSGSGTGIVTSGSEGLAYTVPISCGNSCSANFYVGATVVLTATASPTATFTGWQNCPAPSGNLCTVTAAANVTAVFTYSKPASRHDMKADGRSDVIWYHTGVGGLIAMDANGLSLGSLYILDHQPDLAWKIVGLGDLNADGRADIVWRNETTGRVYGMLMDGQAVLQEREFYYEPNVSWRIEHVADIDGDGRADMVYRNQSTGEVYVLRMNGVQFTNGATIYAEPNLNWKIVAAGDLNGDRRTDLLWRNETTGDVFAMIMGTYPAHSGTVIYNEPNTNWKIVGLVDFDGDGKADVLWRNAATGDVYQMRMDGTTILDGQVIYTEPNADWKIAALGDYNGDGRADILWQNAVTGQVYMMLMNGFAIASGGFVYTEPDTQWRIVGP